MNVDYKIFPAPKDIAESLASLLSDRINSAAIRKKNMSIALSGGNTPGLLFSVLADSHGNKTDWSYVHFFWVDERCVPPGDSESNYGMTAEILLNRIDIPDTNIHRMRGEEDPEKEAERYSLEILSKVRPVNNLPGFDIILLGMGEDGHTASIFPGNNELLRSGKICEVAVHPSSGQKRITLTGNVINNAAEIIYMVTGSGKASVIAEVSGKRPAENDYPAANIFSVYGRTTWMLDSEAGRYI